MSDDEAILPSGTESASASSKKKKKQKQPRKHTDLSDDDKEAIKEWLKLNPVIYNKRLPDFRDTEKLALWAELVDRLGRTVDELTNFNDTARTNMSRVKRMYRSGMSQNKSELVLGALSVLAAAHIRRQISQRCKFHSNIGSNSSSNNIIKQHPNRSAMYFQCNRHESST